MQRDQYLSIRKKLDLSHRSAALAIHWLQNLALIALTYVCWRTETVLAFAGIPLLSTLIFRNFSMMHEAVHKAASKTSWLNDCAGHLAGGICLLPFEPWRKSHLEHHQWAGNIEKDPVMALVNAYPKWQASTQKWFSFLWRAWFPILACMQYSVFYWLAWKAYLKNPKSSKMFISLSATIVVWGAAMAVLPAVFIFQILIPALFAYLIAVEVVNFPHHLQLPQFRGETKIPLWEQYKIARSCLYPRSVARFIALNFNYHTEHHMFPDVPWYHLESLQSEVQKALQYQYNSDPYFQWIVENKRYPIGEVLAPRNSKIAA